MPGVSTSGLSGRKFTPSEVEGLDTNGWQVSVIIMTRGP